MRAPNHSVPIHPLIVYECLRWDKLSERRLNKILRTNTNKNNKNTYIVPRKHKLNRKIKLYVSTMYTIF